MFKSEPKTILQFLATHFDVLRQFFDIQTKNEIITKSQVTETLKEFGSDIENQLFEHKLLVEQNHDYIINEPYFDCLNSFFNNSNRCCRKKLKNLGSQSVHCF